MNTFDDPEDLALQLSSDLAELDTDTAVIGIDGKDGVGKTWLATKLSTLLSAPVVSLDDYLIKDQGGYVPFLRRDDIRRRLAAGVSRLLIDGVCLLAAAEQCGFKVDRLIYVKRMSPYGTWQDAEECDPYQNPEETIDKLTDDLRKFGEFERLCKHEEQGDPPDYEVDLPELTKEVIRYHAYYRPVERADHVFHRVET